MSDTNGSEQDGGPVSRRKFKPLPVADVAHIWEKQLLRSKTGEVKKLLANVVLVLANAPEWAGAIGWDEFASRLMVLRSCPAGEPGPWADLHDKLTAEWLQRCRWRLEVGHEMVAHSIAVVAKKKSFHPLRNRLMALTWDGVERLDTWTTTYLGAEDTLVHQAIGVTWMLGAVARAFEPGVQMDSALILEGPQGRGKSSALRILSLGFFTDELADVGSKDAAMQLYGAWIVELAELDAIGRAEAAKVKAFLTRRVDRFRAPYGRHVEDHARQCVFAGSVNHNDYLKDETGGRRFLPVECGVIDLAQLRAHVEQLWAEAVARYQRGECQFIQDAMVGALVAAHTATRYQGDAWTESVIGYAQVHGRVSIGDCLERVGVERGRWTKGDEMRVSKILKSNGFTRKFVTIDGVRVWRYCANQTRTLERPQVSVVPSNDPTDPTDLI